MKSVAVLTLVMIGVSSQLRRTSGSLHAAAQPYRQMMERGHYAMGFDQTRTTHHFLLQPSGRAIEITANDKSDSASIASIRSHLEHIRGAFAAGNFSMPMFIHGTEPPGADVLSKRRETWSIVSRNPGWWPADHHHERHRGPDRFARIPQIPDCRTQDR